VALAPIVAGMSRAPAPAHPTATAGATALPTGIVLTVEQLAGELARLQPPPAYRLSLDSGVAYRNVCRAVQRPLAARLDTWRRLLRSLRSRLIAAGHGGQAPAWALDPAPCAAGGLRAARRQRGWSQRELARRAGVCVDTVGALERGQGQLAQWQRICTALDLQLLIALPPHHDSVAALWREQAPRCLQAPAPYPRVPRHARRTARGQGS